MKFIFIFIPGLLLLTEVNSQQLQAGANAQVVIYQGGQTGISGLIFNPSSPLTFTALTLNKNTTVTNPFSNPYVSRVFHFAPGTPLFSGSIRFHYLDGELNGLNESTLQLITYNGSSWQLAGSSMSDAGNNYVEATGINNLPLGELMLANSLPLPLTWLNISASRKETTVMVKWVTEQEWNVSHFDVERSMNGQEWTKAITGIPAGNQSQRREYRQTDNPGYAGLLYYRVRQTDIDGKFTLSGTVTVPAERSMDRLIILPNPARQYFELSGISRETIGQVELFNNNGGLIKSWKGFQDRYSLPPLSAGTYLLRIQTVDGVSTGRPLMVK